MFDGVLPREEPEPKQVTAEDAVWSWPLAALVTALTCMAIIASLMFPDTIGGVADHF
jgi:hypothetical protein